MNKTQIPKSEFPKSEGRNELVQARGKSGSEPTAGTSAFGFQLSDFFRTSDFGFRIVGQRIPFTLVLSVLLLGGIFPAQAQWLTQAIDLKPGWNAVQLHVDASHDTLANLVAADAANPILEVWFWAPTVSTMQFVQGPQEPVASSSQWVSWLRSASATSPLQRLAGNAAYLVRVGNNVSSYTWNVKGRPVPPSYQWTTTGLNFLGFPTAPVSPPFFDAFLAQAPELRQNAEIYQYPGGKLGANNPAPGLRASHHAGPAWAGLLDSLRHRLQPLLRSV